MPESSEPCEWFLNDGRPNREWCCGTHRYAGGEAGIEGEEHPVKCEFADLPDHDQEVIASGMPFWMVAPSVADAELIIDRFEDGPALIVQGDVTLKVRIQPGDCQEFLPVATDVQDYDWEV